MTSTGAVGNGRTKTVAWQNPEESAGQLGKLSGLDFLEGILNGSIPPPPILQVLGIQATGVEPSRVTFECDPDESHYNPLGTVHGGLVCTMLDSVLGCAVQTTLPAGLAYTSLELKVNYLRPVTSGSGTLTAVGTVTKPGRRAAFAEGTVTDASGRLVATASGTLLVFPVGG